MNKYIIMGAITLIILFSVILPPASNSENNISDEVIIEKHDWNSEYISLSKEDIDKIFMDSIMVNDNKMKFIILYDGGECNPYISNVLSEAKKVNNMDVIVVTNYNQSYIDANFTDYLDYMSIIGDENKYIAKTLKLYKEEDDRMDNKIVIAKNGDILNKVSYNPRLSVEYENLIK